jgi:hypothetical protein
MLHELPAATGVLVEQALLPVVMAKSAGFVPPSAIELMFNAAVPELLSTAVIAELVEPTLVFGKASVDVSEAVGVPVPVPLSADDCVVGKALSVTVKVAA